MAPTSESRMSVEKLSKAELLMLFSMLEGELEARDLVIEALRAQRRDIYVRERYGKYSLSDPFLALQRDGDVLKGPGLGSTVGETAARPDPLTVLKLVVGHCRSLQEKMVAQLAAAESRHRRVIADLEEEKRRHAEDTAEGDDVTCILEKERERLLQQLEFERGQLRRGEREQKCLQEQLEEERAQHKQLSATLSRECKRASGRVQEEAQRAAEAARRLERERGATQALRAELEAEERRALRTEARMEEQLAEFDTEREQLHARLRKQEAQNRELQRELERLRGDLAALRRRGEGREEETPSSGQTEMDEWTSEPQTRENGFDTLAIGSPGPSSLTASPFSSPILAKRLANLNSASLQASYQAGINQRFHAARHKFQGHLDPEAQGNTSPQSPCDLSPCATPSPETSPARHLARSAVTQALSRFAVQQPPPGRPPASPNSSPFGTDYRSLAPNSPSTLRVSGAPSPGIRSPTVPRSDRGNPPPIPPKKPGLGQAPASPAPVARASHFPELSASCGLTSNQESVKELDMVVSSSG
ncbi:CTTNBP2 N-terminal-like protein [Denticeps clupeoides]|uniref:CTTNBP2 N-terminal-like protein n=1 Tax=Denticeps clupeoides TaxID=299321 RepID=UPI0010A4858F|nr:CTTNBP2 N-terminal-like protein [Denticeps clupeoides]